MLAALANLAFMLKRFAIFALCAVLGIGLPLYTAYAAPAGGEHHAMMSHADGMPDCGSQGDQGVDCAQYCAAVCAGMVLPAAPCASADRSPSERVVMLPLASFESQAGAPGLQPPR
jgi:hypothetical protein